ncbi:MAG: DUF1549 and DUF1553 domain-containing protein [Prosthecobacter sp.]|uniref:DUF1549 domain-containing protein n=1 Tax=Prosthecobacter sp. TaxID=1965333 RepID=UPI0025D62F0B|nr:DUF1549 domain-containing protein [Prosthecobacter sp.]MCF7784466.1 DUF1549 and DUF1553 domain-containing protein [Prosthecobacter sp.]
MKAFTRKLLITLGFAAAANANEASQQIDALLAKDWQQHKLTANPPASDETLVRRLHLDIIGRIPTLQEAQAFLGSTDKDKRAKLIDQLLASDGYAQRMFHFWADLLRIQTRSNGGQGDMTSKPYLEHVKRRIRENMPYDDFVHELLTAQGKVWDNPAIGYYMRDIGMPLDNLANTTRVFLGTRIECAQCHNHPFDKWTQMQFYQMAAFTYPLETNFTGIAQQQGAFRLMVEARKKPELEASTRNMGRVFENLGDFVRYSKVQPLPSRLLKLPHDYQYPDAKPKDVISPLTMLGKSVKCEPTGETTKAFADWLTSSDNPRFTTVIANRLWKQVFGAGLIEPVDEILDSTVASNPALMKHLEQLMRDSRYNLKAYLRVLYNTQAYQNEVSRAELYAGEVCHFSGPLLRRMSAEQIYDSFVTLIHPTPDLPRSQGIDSEMAQKIVYRGKLSDALDLLTSQEIFDGAARASEGYERIAERSKVLRAQYTAAQKAKDKPLLDKLNVEIRSLEFTARTGIHDYVVVPAVARLYTQKTGKPAPPPIPVKAPTLDELKKAGQNRAYIHVPGYDIDQVIPSEEKAAEQARENLFHAEIKRLGITDTDAYLKSRRAHAREWPRAADLESPAPRGHYLREFGQSDRDIIDNANTDASMPQALVLMNSELFQSILKPHTQLKLNLSAAKYPDEQLNTVYQTLLSRTPTATEKASWASAEKTGLNIEDLIFALINTQQFIFVR